MCQLLIKFRKGKKMKFYYVPIYKKKKNYMKLKRQNHLEELFFWSEWKLILFFPPKKRMIDKVTYNAILGLGFQLWAKSNNN